MADPRSWPHRPPPAPPDQWPPWSPAPLQPRAEADPESRGRPRWLAPVAVGVVIAMLAVVGAGVLTARDDPVVEAGPDVLDSATDEAGSADPDPTPADPPTTDPSPPTSTDPDELDALVAELVAFVETAREADFVTDPVVEFYGDADFEQRLEETFLDDETLELTEIEDKLYHALGLLEPGESQLEIVTDLLASGVVGFYDPETAELAVRGTDLNPYVASTVVHELVHALDDQLHDLDKEEWDELSIDESGAVTAVIEGNARRVEEEWTDTLSSGELDEYAAEEAAAAAGADYESFPQWMVELLLAPYQLGQQMVSAVDAEEDVDALFADPPDSTEQVLDPAALDSDEQPLAVPTPESDGLVVEEGTLGALMLYVMMLEYVDDSSAAAVATGWGGDSYVLYDHGDAACVRIDVVGDSASATTAISEALGAFAEASPAEASAETVDGRPRLTSCGLR